MGCYHRFAVGAELHRHREFAAHRPAATIFHSVTVVNTASAFGIVTANKAGYIT